MSDSSLYKPEATGSRQPPTPADLAAPNPFLTWSEGMRSAFEFGALLSSWRSFETLSPGDGHAVLVLPGFANGDGATIYLRRFLRQLGYDVCRWDLGHNTGHQSIQSRLHHRVNEMVTRTSEPFTVIGHSLGGVYARELAQSFPSHVRQVISLGSPFRSQDGEGVGEFVHRLYERTSGQTLAARSRSGQDALRAPRVPTTAIFSRTDGVAAWELCVEDESATAENIEVYGSHCGMPLNPLVFRIIADRLAQPVGQWGKFDTATIAAVVMEMANWPVREMLTLGFRNPWQGG